MTGAARGLGRSIAERFLELGARVAVSDLDANALACVVDELDNYHPGRVHASTVDVRSDESVDAFFAGVADWGGTIDVLVNAAGVIARSRSEGIASDVLTAVLDINVAGVLRCCRAAFPHLERNGTGSCIINFASVGATLGMPGRAGYNASKSAVVGITRTLAVEWGSLGVRVNAIAPGFIDTAMMRSGLDNGALDERRLLARIPLRRLGDVSDVVGVATFLASPDAKYVTGAVVAVDGGVTIDGTFGDVP